MKQRILLASSIFAATLTAAAAPTCNPGQVVQGNNCTFTAALGWATAGLGTQSVLNLYVPPNASGPVAFHITKLSSSLGNGYSGYLGIRVGDTGKNDSSIVTLADITTGAPGDIGQIAPGTGGSFTVTQVCWDPTCTSPAPAGAIPNMFSMEFLMASPTASDLSPIDILGTVQFLNDTGQVTFETTERSVHGNAPFMIVPGINIGATPGVRYVMNGAAFIAPFDAVSISNLDNTSPVSGTVSLKDFEGNTIASIPFPSIPPGGAAGYLVVGRTPDDTLGLLPSSLVLPAGSDGVFHGILEIQINGVGPTTQVTVLAQEYNGNAMLNLPVFGSGKP